MSNEEDNPDGADSCTSEEEQAPRSATAVSRRDLLATTAAGVTALFVGVGAGSDGVAAAGPGEQEWAFETDGTVYASPTVADGTVYVGSLDDNLYAVDAATGDRQWAFETGGDVQSSPTVADGTVYVGSRDNNLYAVDAATGDQQWAFQTDGDVNSSPTVVDGTVYVGTTDYENDTGELYAVDASTGDQQWSFVDRSIFSSPTVVDTTVYFGCYDSNLYAVDAATGNQQWSFETGNTLPSSPTVVDGTVYVGSRDNNLYAVDAATGDRQWAFETGDWVESSPTVINSTVYIESDDANLYAVEAATGREQWTFDTAGDEGGSSPTVANSTVYVGAVNGNLYAVDAATGDQQWAFETGDSVFSSPTVADGTVYVGSYDDNLYAVGTDHTKSSSGSRARLETLGHHVQSPTARFSVTPTQPVTGTTVAFDASDSSDEAEIASYEWDFDGDGTVDATGQEPTHTYTTAGSYAVTLTVTDVDGLTATTTQTVTVSQANQPPTATFTVTPTDPAVGNTVTFDASGASDDSGIAGYEWDFDGDGTVDATGQQATHTYDSPGVYTVTLRVTDDDGATASSDTTLSVSQGNAAPTPAFTLSPSAPTTGTPVSFDASDTTDDSGIAGYEWDFTGDGTTDATGEQVTHTYDETGTYTITLTVTDTDGATATTTQTITVSEGNQPPTAAFTLDPSSPTTEATVSFDASSASDDTGITQYQWDFDGDGTIDATGQQPTHQYDTPGTYTVELTVRDADGATDATTRTITVSDPETTEQNSETSGADTFSYTPSAPRVDTTVTFDANNFPSDATAASYEWDFDGDGTADAFGSTVRHIFSSGGTQTVTLTAELESGETETVRRTVLINTPPEPAFTVSPSPAIIEEPTTFDAGETNDSTGSIRSYEWDFDGDGTVDKTGRAVTHTFSERGRPTVTLRVTDSQGVTATRSRSVTVQRAAEFSLQLRDTTITPDEQTTAAITVNSLLGSERLFTQLALDVPSGWDVSFVNASSSSGGTATEIFETQAGQTRTIRARISPNDTGEFSVSGQAFYFVGDRSPPRHTRQLSSGTLTVTDGETATSESTSTPTEEPTPTPTETSTGTPGFGLGAGATALGAGLGLLRSLDLLDSDRSELGNHRSESGNHRSESDNHRSESDD